MKLSRSQLRKLILEAAREIKVKPVSDAQYKKDVASLPPPMKAVSTGQRTSATVKRPNHMVGNFFMTQGVPYETEKGYKAINKFIDFYMVMPSGEAIKVNPNNFILEKVSDGMRFLKLLDQNVEVLPIENIHDITDQDGKNIIKMRQQVATAMAEFKNTIKSRV